MYRERERERHRHVNNYIHKTIQNLQTPPPGSARIKRTGSCAGATPCTTPRRVSALFHPRVPFGHSVIRSFQYSRSRVSPAVVTTREYP